MYLLAVTLYGAALGIMGLWLRHRAFCGIEPNCEHAA
jgi:hypothetical protein